MQKSTRKLLKTGAANHSGMVLKSFVPKKAKKKGGFGTDADIAAMSEEELKQQAELLELE